MSAAPRPEQGEGKHLLISTLDHGHLGLCVVQLKDELLRPAGCTGGELLTAVDKVTSNTAYCIFRRIVCTPLWGMQCVSGKRCMSIL